MAEFVHGFGACLPSIWLDGAGVTSPTCGASEDFLSQERVELDAVLDELVNGPRAEKTLVNLRNAALRAKALFKAGYVLPHIESSGFITKNKRMSYASFVLFLRHALTVTGMPAAKATKYAGHSMRAGGATSAAIHGLSPAEICHLAGVKDVNWLTWFNRHYLASRIRASRSIGL